MSIVSKPCFCYVFYSTRSQYAWFVRLILLSALFCNNVVLRRGDKIFLSVIINGLNFSQKLVQICAQSSTAFLFLLRPVQLNSNFLNFFRVAPIQIFKLVLHLSVKLIFIQFMLQYGHFHIFRFFISFSNYFCLNLFTFSIIMSISNIFFKRIKSIIQQYFRIHSSMNSTDNENAARLDYQKIYHELDEVVDTYHENFQHVFNSKQHALIEQLEQRSKKLKSQITRYEQLTSQQSISALVIKKKQQKQAERLELQKNWRDLTDKLKKLEEQGKKLVSENSEYKFDIQNLQSKIEQLIEQNSKLTLQLQKIPKTTSNETFVTEACKKEYISPYKTKVKDKKIQRQRKWKDDKIRSINQRLSDINRIKQIPTNILIQFLSKRDVKNQIYQILKFKGNGDDDM